MAITGSVPGELPGRGSRPIAQLVLPTDRLHFGVENENGNDPSPAPESYGWLANNGIRVQYRYHYLADSINGSDPSGCGANTGWQTWGGGQWVEQYIDESNALPKVGGVNVISVFTYYVLVPSQPGAGSDTDETRKISNACTMTSYWQDFKVLMQRIRAKTTSTVIVHVEPDFWGSMEQVNADPTQVPAVVSSTGLTDLSGLPNNMVGVGLAFRKLRDLYAPNVLLGIHASTWGSGQDLASDSTCVNSDPIANADSVGNYLSAVGVTGGGVSSTWDLVFNDIADHDSGSSNNWWDTANVNCPNFTRWLTFMTELHSKTGKQLVEWQVPVGNQVYRVMNNTCGHYQDNKVGYLFGHPSSLTAAGIIAVLIGKANGCQSQYFDEDGDGVPASQPGPISTPGCNLCNVAFATVSDDDGGFLRSELQQYYTPATVPGAPTAVVAVADDFAALVTWLAPASDGGAAITGYTVTSAPGGKTAAVGTALWATVLGLNNGTSYTFTVRATNSVGAGPPSAASNAVVPGRASVRPAPAPSGSPPARDPVGPSGHTPRPSPTARAAGPTVSAGPSRLTITMAAGLPQTTIAPLAYRTQPGCYFRADVLGSCRRTAMPI